MTTLNVPRYDTEGNELDVVELKIYSSKVMQATFFLDGQIIQVHNMPRKTNVAEALLLSIRKWLFMIDCVKGNPDKGILDNDAVTCALCQKYVECYGCPIMILTSSSGCVSSPWIDYRWATTQKERLLAAQDMLTMLVDLYVAWEEGRLEDGVDYLDFVGEFLDKEM